jgi:hypothetical protein
MHPHLSDHAKDAMDETGRALLQYGCSVADLYHSERNHQGKSNILLFPNPDELQTGRNEPIRCSEGLAGCSDTAIAPRGYFS